MVRLIMNQIRPNNGSGIWICFYRQSSVYSGTQVAEPSGVINFLNLEVRDSNLRGRQSSRLAIINSTYLPTSHTTPQLTKIKKIQLIPPWIFFLHKWRGQKHCLANSLSLLIWRTALDYYRIG